MAVRDVEREILSTLRDLRDLTELENARMMRAILAIEGERVKSAKTKNRQIAETKTDK